MIHFWDKNINKVSFGYLSINNLLKDYPKIEKIYTVYITTNIVAHKFYFGTTSFRVASYKNNNKKFKHYIGNGLRKDCKKVKEELRKLFVIRDGFIAAVFEYGYEAFNRKDLLFFKNEEDALKAEAILIDKDLLKRKDVYNIKLGGHQPPTLHGKENGNYGKRWSDEKRRESSLYFKNNRNFLKEANPNSKEMYVLDLRKNKL